jgi:hypothetical protein
MSAIEEEVLIGTAMTAGRINDGDVRKTALEKAAVLKPELSRNQQQQAWRTASTHARQEGHLKQTQVKSQRQQLRPDRHAQSSSNGGGISSSTTWTISTARLTLATARV